METNPFDRLRAHFLKARTEKWGAVAASVGTAVTFAALIALLYLFADLMVWKGVVPSYAQLPAAKKRAAADEWATRWSDADRAEAVRRVGVPVAAVKRVVGESDAKAPPSAAEWEGRWRANAYLGLKDRVGFEAAETYAGDPGADDDPTTPPRLGLLSLVVRERDRWTGRAIGWVAAWNPWAWRPGADRDANPSYLAGLFVLAFGLALVRGVLLNATAYLAAAATLDTLTRVRRAVYFHTYRIGAPTVRADAVAEPVDLFTRQSEAVGEAVHTWLTSAFRYPVQFALLLGIVLLVNFWLAVSFLLLVLLGWVVAGQVAAYFQQEARAAGRQGAAVLTQLRESMGIIRLVKSYAMERFNQSRVERQLAEAGRAHWRRMRGNALSGPLLLSVAAAVAVALLYLAGRACLGGELGAAGLVVMATAVASMSVPVVGWFEARRTMRRGREASAAVFEFLDRKGGTAEAADAEFVPALSNRLEFRQVSVREPGSGKPVLDDVSFAVPAGSRVAVVGPDEAAKRALVALIPRFLDPTTGEVRMDDKNVRWVTHESLRAQVAVVLQDDLVFGDSVLNNIATGDPGYSLPQVIEAAKVAHAHQFIERLPYGYETLVGDHGYSLTPGEQFRIALARAVLRDPSLIVVEEPAGPMDEDALALLDDTIDRVAPGRTIIFLARRQSTLRAADRVFFIRNGKLEAAGSHRDLWRENENYRRLQVVADATAEAV